MPEELTAQIVAAGTALLYFALNQAVAALPQGKPGGKWDLIRRILNPILGNWGNAQNRDKFPPKRG